MHCNNFLYILLNKVLEVRTKYGYKCTRFLGNGRDDCSEQAFFEQAFVQSRLQKGKTESALQSLLFMEICRGQGNC